MSCPIGGVKLVQQISGGVRLDSGELPFLHTFSSARSGRRWKKEKDGTAIRHC
jgi:hypothetical protein